MQNNQLITKYNVPGPRYTSYPTVPYWEAEKFQLATWKNKVKETFVASNQPEGISLYIHLPYCENLCTFCGCNKRITKNHSVEVPYISAVLQEWAIYVQLLGERPLITELHLGGGSPTFFQPENLKMLIEGIFETAVVSPKASLSFEGNPNTTTEEHLQTLFDLGFRRVSFGIQDFDPEVQEVINRIQPYQKVEWITQLARKIGYNSVNYDIIYGLPLQKIESIEDTIKKVQQLRPDRIAFYSYAHVPWIKGVGQRKFTEADLPKAEEKRALYELGREMLEAIGYREVGMDHFALESDSLWQACKEGYLHRNFMGYTDQHTALMIGLGVSSIGDSWTAFAQNVKTVENYMEIVAQGELPVFRGHILTDEDLVLRKHILNIICHFQTHWSEEELSFTGLAAAIEKLPTFAADGLLMHSYQTLEVTHAGKAFIRNICMAFDARLWQKQPETQLFSMTI